MILFIIIQQQEIMQQDIQNTKSFKVKVAILFGYNGQQFQGMQYQKQTDNTVQNILHKIIVDNGMVLKSNAQQLRRIQWSRAARTDKGVHALLNGVSLKLQIYPKYVLNAAKKEVDYEKIVRDINKELPMDIRIFSMKKVGKGFDMRHDSNSRVYNYIAPAKLFQKFQQFQANHLLTEQELQDLIAKLNVIVKSYLGTHNFHNFTNRYKKTDPRCDRFMISMTVEKLQKQTINQYLDKKDHLSQSKTPYQDFIRFTLVGQSFIYHQIRKMIGLLIRIFSEGLEGPQSITTAFTEQQFQAYLAPAQGLYLNRMIFDHYNARKQPSERIQMTEEDQDKILRYRAYLQERILQHELKQQVFTNWLTNLREKKLEHKQQSAGQKSDQN